MRKYLLPILLFCSAIAHATNYTVKAGGGGSFTTIAACASAVVAGDTCTVFAGTYNELVTLATAGTSGSRITFTVNPGDTVQIYGFNINANYNTVNGFLVTDPTQTHSSGIDITNTGSRTGVWITNNTLTQTSNGQPCIMTHGSTPDSFTVISGNTVSWCNTTPNASGTSPQTGIETNGDHFLVQNNNISHTTNGFSGTFTFSFFMSNSYGPVNDTVDFPSCSCDTHADMFELNAPSSTTGFDVLEGNTEENILGIGGAHFIIAASSGSTVIARFNNGFNVGTAWVANNGSATNFTNYKSYNETVVSSGSQNTSAGIDTWENAPNGAIINSLFYNSVKPTGSANGYFSIDTPSLSGFSIVNNLAFDSSCSPSTAGNCLAAPISTGTGTIWANPLLVATDGSSFALQSGSPAIAAGVNLTTVASGDSGSGTSLVVTDAHYFQDGYGITGVNADCVSVTTVTNHVCITAVNYSTNTLTLASGITRSVGDHIWLYSNSSGTQVLTGTAPNVGSGFLSVGPQTLYLTPLLIANGSTSNTINVSCPTCLGWVVGTPGTPTFTVGYGTLVSQTVTSPTTATVVVTPSVTNNYTYITAPRVSGVASPALGVLTVQATFAAGQPFIVNGTTGNVVALTGIGASWTSTSPTFSISGCGTATKTAQAVLTDATATITLSAGSTDCTITITDSSTSNTTTLAVHTPAHWYVDKAIGGTRYSSNVTTGQCNGTADAAYPGSGTNQNCAFGDVRYMWQDGSSPSSMTFPAYGWLMQGGDTLTIVGSIAGGVSYRIGWPTAAGPGSSVPYFGISGDANDSGMPSPPSGIASQHTIIQGGNAGACTAQTARTQLHGGWGLDTVIYIGTPLKYTSTTASNSDFIDFQCVDVTDFAVGKTGGDYALSGAIISLAAHDLTFTDTRWHGLAQDCWLGTAGGTLTATDITWAGCGLSGWEADQGVNVTGFGAQNITNFQIEGNGCNEEYPIVDTFPYVGCSDDLSGGYGDGFGTASINSPPPGWQIHFDQGIADYNTQEGIDALHAAGANSSSSITRTLAYGNMGQQFKIGGGGTVANSQITNNCSAMKYPISGFPAPIAIVSWSITSNVASFVTATQSLTAGAYVALSGFGTSTFFNQVTNLTVSATGLSSTTFQVPFTHVNGAATEAGAFTTWNGQLSSFCRAANTGIVIEIPPATTSYFEYNTIYAASGVTLEIEPYDVLFGGVWVGTEGFQYVDNVQVDNSGATPIYNQSNGSLAPLTNTGGAWKYNLTYQGASWTCPQSGESNGLCGTPGLSNQSYPIYGYNVMTPASGSSAVVGAGIPISGITIDYAGNARSLTTPTLGANEYLVPVQPPTSLGGAAVYGGDAVTH